MQIAILLFDNLTALEAVGPYEVLSRLPGAQTVLVGERTGPFRTDTGRLALVADATLEDVPHPDVVVVPGGSGQTAHMDDGAVHDWLRRADGTSTWTTSTCTGSLILSAAGLLVGRRATTHWLAVDQLAALGVTPVSERVVFDDKYVTAAGVSAGIDMALALATRIAGALPAQAIQLGLEYAPQPPHDAGSPATAPAPVRDVVRSQRDHILFGGPRRPATATVAT